MAKSKYEKVKKLFPKIKHLIEIEGYNEKELIDYLPIGKDTFYRYKKKHKDFSDLIENSRDVLIEQVEKSFIKRAIGYDYEEVHSEQIFEYVNGKPVAVGLKVKKVKKKMHGSVPAQLAILKRLAGWREIDYEQNNEQEIDYNDEARKQALLELMEAEVEQDDEF
jgi:hypothetical protein